MQIIYELNLKNERKKQNIFLQHQRVPAICQWNVFSPVLYTYLTQDFPFHLSVIKATSYRAVVSLDFMNHYWSFDMTCQNEKSEEIDVFLLP